MRTTKIGSNAQQLTFYSLCNCYLVAESDGFTLIDAVLPGCSGNILAAAQQAGQPIRRLLLTHAHSDHVGSLDALHDALGDVDVVISEREAPMLHKDLSLRPGEPQQKPKGGYPGVKARPTHTLTDGELFGSLRCISTPGHTPGHMSFLDERDGTLYAGDAMMSIGGLHTINNPPWYFPLPKMASWDLDLALASARKLAALKPSGIGCGHGAFVPNGAAAMDAVLAREPKA